MSPNHSHLGIPEHLPSPLRPPILRHHPLPNPPPSVFPTAPIPSTVPAPSPSRLFLSAIFPQQPESSLLPISQPRPEPTPPRIPGHDVHPLWHEMQPPQHGDVPFLSSQPHGELAVLQQSV